MFFPTWQKLPDEYLPQFAAPGKRDTRVGDLATARIAPAAVRRDFGPVQAGAV
jgi:hypothetical protein